MSHSTSKTTQTNPYAISQYNDAKASLGNSQYKPITGADIQGFQSPYQSQVMDAFHKSNDQSRMMAQNSDTDRAISQGAFGGTGLDVAHALTNGQYDLNSGNFDANLLNQGFNTALGAAQTQNLAQNQYPLAIQQLLGNLAGQTQTNTKGSSTSGNLDDIGKLIKIGSQIGGMIAGTGGAG